MNMALIERTLRWIDIFSYFVYDDEFSEECYAIAYDNIEIIKLPYLTAAAIIYGMCLKNNMEFDFATIEKKVEVHKSKKIKKGTRLDSIIKEYRRLKWKN